MGILLEGPHEPEPGDPERAAAPWLHVDIERYFAPGTDEVVDRLQTDTLLYYYFRERGFVGSQWDYFSHLLLAYGLATVTALVRSGGIFARCTRGGWGVGTRPVDLRPADAEELASDVVQEGFAMFHRRGLVTGQWLLHRGMSLKEYFVHACVLCFPNQYRRWQRSRREWRDVHLLDAWPCAEELGAITSPEDAMVSQSVVDAVFRRVGEDDRAIFLLVHQGYSYVEIAETMRLTERAVEARVYRARKTARTWADTEGGL